MYLPGREASCRALALVVVLALTLWITATTSFVQGPHVRLPANHASAVGVLDSDTSAPVSWPSPTTRPTTRPQTRHPTSMPTARVTSAAPAKDEVAYIWPTPAPTVETQPAPSKSPSKPALILNRQPSAPASPATAPSIVNVPRVVNWVRSGATFFLNGARAN